MALTAQDVAAKEFSTSSRLGRGGYDEAEVDDFLDEVEAELTRLTQENDELRVRLGAAERELELARSQPPEVAAPAPAAPVAEQASGILALAQKTADEHVAQVTSEAERLLREARGQAEQVTRGAEEQRRATLGALEGERVGLERAIEELRAFEREYRSRLKSYLEAQLRDLEGRGDTPGAPA